MNSAAIIVTYNPDLAALVRLCHALAGSAQVIVVDNSEPAQVRAPELPPGCRVLALGHNAGIAHAQNVGINAARAGGAGLIFFFDQDSTIDASYVLRMAQGVDPQVAAVYGPVCIDAARGFEYPAYRLGRFGLPGGVSWAGPPRLYPVDLIISSGSLATAAALDKAGLMDEDFFIDYVDLEWCLRCRSRAIPIFMNQNVTMTHSVGMRSVKLGPITTFIHSPLRTYYKMRNPFLLLRKKDVGLPYAAREIASALLHHLLQLLMLGERRKYAGPIAAGLRDGLLGSAGKR
jgi:rhamnosyltransferase